MNTSNKINRDNKFNGVKIVAIILSLLLVVGLVVGLFFIYYKSGVLTDFYIKINDTQLVRDYRNGYYFYSNEEYKIEPIYILDSGSEEHKNDYSVKVISYDSDKTRFEFNTGDNTYVYNNIDFTDNFEIQKEEGYFTFKSKYESFEDLLEEKFGEVTILNDYSIDYINDYLSLIVTSYDNSKEVKVNFNVGVIPENIIVSEDNLIF